MALLPRITRNAVTSGRGVVADEASRYQASAYADLARSARIVGETVRKREVEAGLKEGETAFRIAEAEARDGGPVSVPTREGGLLDFLGVKDEAYFQAVQTLQATRAERDAERAITDIRGESYASPTEFRERAEAWRTGYIGDMTDPASARAAQAEIDKLIEKNLLEVTRERQDADIKEARTGMDAKVASVESEIDAMLRDGGPGIAQDPAFQRLIADRETLLDMKTDNPLYAYSGDERTLDDQKYSRRVQTAVLTPQIREVYEIEGRAGALEAAEEAIAGLGLDGAEAVAMRSSLRNEINLMAEVDSAREAERTAAEKRRKDYLTEVKEREERAFIDVLFNPD
ncbi:MAG: hypothetical protein KAH44_14140, partial [Oricola sp.]|nr:hypothetical protein [Oricola sp.]